MPNPEHQSPEQDDHQFSESELLDLEYENLRAQSEILKPLFFNPNMMSPEEIQTIILYASLVGQEAENQLRNELLRRPEVRAWTQLEHFVLRDLPQVFEDNPYLFLEIGVDTNDALTAFHDALTKAKLYKQLHDEEIELFQKSEHVLGHEVSSTEKSAQETYQSLIAESLQLSKHFSMLIRKHGLARSTTSFLFEEELLGLPTEQADEILRTHALLQDIRTRYIAILNWQNRVLFQISTADITREYIVAIVDRFADLPKETNLIELLTTMKQDLLLKTTNATKSVTNTTTTHTEPIPTKLPGKPWINLSYMNTGDEMTSRFIVEISNRAKSN